MPRIRKEIEIEAPAAQVWTYVGTQAGLQQWWGQEILLEAKEGGRCEEKGTLDGVPYHRVGKVTIYDPPRQLTLAFQELAGQAWAHTTISLSLAEANGRTTVTVVQQAHGIGQRRPDAVPSDEGKPQSQLYPPLLQAGEAREVPTMGAAIGGLPSPGSPLRHGHAAVGNDIHPYEHVWQERLAALHLIPIPDSKRRLP